MAGVAKQIIGSFEDIGKDVVQEVAKVPGDIAGKAMESLGASSQKPKQQVNQATQQGPLQQIEQTTDQKAKQAMAREALAQLAGNQKQKEPTVQERLQKEEMEKKEAAKKQQATQMAPLAAVSSKPKRGNLYGVKQKSTAVENKNTRQD